MNEFDIARNRVRESLTRPLMTESERLELVAKRDAQLIKTGHYLEDCNPGKEPTMGGRCFHCGVEVPDNEADE
jgi:hypothetical protein